MKENPILNFISKYIVYFLAFFLYFLTRWISKNFGDVSFDQVLYHMQFGASNLLDTDPELVEDFYKRSLKIPAAIALIFTVIHTYGSKIAGLLVQGYKLAYRYIHNNRISSAIFSKALHIQILFCALIYVAFKLSVFTYIKDQVLWSKEDFYTQNYVHPNSVELKRTASKNLILIYVESLENTYNNSDLFNINLIRRIEPPYLGGQMFTKWRQLPGTNWTIAGIVGTQCGIPLKHSLGGGGGEPNNRIFKNTPSFLPNAVCLGDILKKEGYKNIYMQGATLKFAGKDEFFRSHGYEETYGREEILAMSDQKMPTNNWGIYDDDLLRIAKERIDELESNPDQPYNLTLLTVDTHQPEGHLSRTCAQRGVKKFKDIVRCTSELVSELTVYIKEKGYLENTSVVIMGDHLAMTNPHIKKIRSVPERFVFNNYVTSNTSLVKNRDEFVHFDHFPSILDSIGLEVNGGKLGLGISGFGQKKLTSEQEKDRYESLKKNTLRYSPTYQEFWSASKKSN